MMINDRHIPTGQCALPICPIYVMWDGTNAKILPNKTISISGFQDLSISISGRIVIMAWLVAQLAIIRLNPIDPLNI